MAQYCMISRKSETTLFLYLHVRLICIYFFCGESSLPGTRGGDSPSKNYCLAEF